MIADIESLMIYGGIHRKKLGMYQMLARRFPYAIYYEIIEDVAYVAAILPMRRNPEWLLHKLEERLKPKGGHCQNQVATVEEKPSLLKT